MTPAARRRVVTVSLLRSGATVVVLVVLYYLNPLDRSLDAGTVIAFAIGLLAFACVVAWQVRGILSSDVPRFRAIQAVAVDLPLLLLLFASTYVVISHNASASFSEAPSHTDALYFTVTVFATVGFGDIVPRSEVARIVTMTQMMMGLIAVGLVAKIVLGAVQVAVRRRDDAASGDAEPRDVGGPETRLPADGAGPGSGPEGG
jgi:voltage-gated potassium channel